PLAWFVSSQNNDLRLLQCGRCRAFHRSGADFALPVKKRQWSGQGPEKATESDAAALHSPSFNASRL
ncbi:hypothetical protein, partial [Bradyrhizobium sp.]|uniref:hypothetical protein n=1 Tax=Bradyrhizobium sp. TaxID=376 RepID=UPI0029076C38